jgi:hypothetical protein
MKKEMAVKKNLDLLDTFMKYAFDHPDILDQIPPDAELIIFPKDDPEFLRENRKLAEAMTKAGKKNCCCRTQKTSYCQTSSCSC